MIPSDPDELLRRLRQRLAQRPPMLRTDWDGQPAAVLVPLYLFKGGWHALYTRRTDKVETHQGQVAFPGGLIEERDRTPREAALREAQEEIGLDPRDVAILGSLDPIFTVTRFIITPMVGILPWPYEFRPNREEVARIFGVPIRWLSNPQNLQIRFRKPLVPGPEIPVHFFQPYEGEIIWGATARITLGLLETMALR